MQNTENDHRELKNNHDARETSCVVIGGGQTGAMLSLLLSQNDVPVNRLESYEDFDRNVDSDVVHPAVAEILKNLGFAEQDPDSSHHELPLTLPTLLVVPAAPAAEEPASIESPAEDSENGTNENQEEHEESQFELGRAQGRIELLEQELRQREDEISNLRKSSRRE